MAHTLFAAKLPSSEPLTGRRVFIASLHWNNEDILRDGWSDALVELVERLRGNINGYSNVYVSVYESGSWDGTKAALQELDVRMGQHNIARRIVIDNTTHADVMASPPADGKGWVKDEDGKSRLRRIPYLAGLRNKVLEPLWEQQERGVNYDHILFLEDVLFRANEVETLLSTNNGNYEAACAVDVKTPPYLYDTFALRDNEGHAPLMLRWPCPKLLERYGGDAH
ncbi:hypothetical protein SBRCBS47491_006407 [Sporothrix bragantina]|uniref:Uncharacterized protein n=1 Tax=Sporothrix bragantina TaxID=671064 RepID=A0ABP0C4M6_9PEZI